MDIKNRVVDIIAGAIKVNRDRIAMDTAVGDIPTWDSFAQMVILQSVQDEFGVVFDPEEMMDIETVSDIIKTIETKIDNLA